MFIYNTLIYNIKPDLSINNDNIEALSIETVKIFKLMHNIGNLQECILNWKSI